MCMKKLLTYILGIITALSISYSGFQVLNGESTFFWRIVLVGSWVARDDIQNTYMFDSTVPAQIPARIAIGWGNIDTRCFGWGSQMQEMFGTMELPHDLYSGTGSVISPHIHRLAEQTEPAQTGIWYLDYMVLKPGQSYSWSLITTISGTIYGFTWRQMKITELDGDMSATGLSLWDMISFRIYRVPTWSDTYSSSMCIQQLGFHYMKDVMGSREEYIK